MTFFGIISCLLLIANAVNQEYNITCGGAGACGSGGSYTFTQTKPSVGSPVADPALTCSVGDVITFVFPGALAAHPFDIIDPVSGSRYPGITGYPVTSATTVSFTCPSGLGATPARYTCNIHSAMTNTITLAGGPASICDKYSARLGITNLQLVTAVVTGTENGLLGNSSTRPYFDGTRPTGSTNFTSNSAALTSLTNGLVKFFGGALGCTDGTITPYTGAALDVIHKGMGVTKPVFDNFNEILLNVTRTAGVNATDNAVILSVLQSTQPQIVFPETICEKYARILSINQFQLVSAVVSGTENGLLANATTLPFFNGVTPPGSTDFTTNSAALTALTNGLVTFFGKALGCTDGTIQLYTGRTMSAVHQPLGINGNVFDTFNQILLNVTRTAGVDTTDNAAILTVLESLRTDIVFQTQVSICDKYSSALNITNLQLITTVVTNTESGLLANATTSPFFTGIQPPGSTDFTSNSAALTTLTNNLVTFFGTALGCTDGTVGAYGGRTLKQAHTGMGVTGNVFDSFNQILLGVTRTAGVSDPDNAAILTVLESTRPDIVEGGAATSVYRVTCGSGPLACGPGGVYAIEQISPTPSGSPSADPDITCVGNEIITFQFPTALPTHPFSIIDASSNVHPNIGPGYPYTSAGSITFQCGSFLLSNPAYYTCLAHGGSVGAAMTGRIVYVDSPTGQQGPTDAPPPPTDPVPTDPPPPNSITYDVTCGGAGPCGGSGVYSLQLTRPFVSAIQGDGIIYCADGDIIIFNFPRALGSAHPFQIIDGNGGTYPGLGAGYPITTAGQVQFTCDANRLSAVPAYFTCLVHGGMPGAAMTGQIMIGPLPSAIPTNNPGSGPTAVAQPTSGTSICDKYSLALKITNLALVQSVVSGTITDLLADPNERPFFNGETPKGSTDFTSNAAAAATLASQLVNFFGPPLGCSDGTIPPYVPSGTLSAIHQPMGITDAIFDGFNNILVGVLAKAGVTSDDQAAVLAILRSLRTQIVQGATGPTDPGFSAPNAPSSGLVAGIVILCVVLALALGGVAGGFIFTISGGSSGGVGKGHDDYDLM